MPKIAEIEDTPNPNAVKFVLKERLAWGSAKSYGSLIEAKGGAALSNPKSMWWRYEQP